jgi:hypothetical protein
MTFSDKPKGESFGSPLKDYARFPHTPQASRSLDFFQGIGYLFACLLVLVVVGAIMYGFYYFLFMPDREQLSNKYNVPIERVTVQPKPHGCDFSDAPLGDKHCHYDKHVYVYDKNGQVIGIDGKPQTCTAECGPAYSVVQAFIKVED